MLLLPLLKVAAAALSLAGGGGGLTLTHFSNTALRGGGSAATAPVVVPSLDGLADCGAGTCGRPSSLLLTGRLAPPMPGHYGFNVTFDPPLPFPSPEAYARLWINDHLQHPRCTTGWAPRNGVGQSGRSAPLWIPLPPRALSPSGVSMAQPGGSSQDSFEVRFEYVCLALHGCTPRKISIRWATYPPTPPPLGFQPMFAPIPSSALVPTQSQPEQQRRALAAQLQTGWLTSYYPSMWAFVLHPESFIVRIGLYRRSTGDFLSAEGITPTKQQLGRHRNNPTMTHAVRAGMHAWNSSYTQSSVVWIGQGGNINVSIATTLDPDDSSQLTLVADVIGSGSGAINRSDYLLVLYPNHTHGRSGTVSANSRAISGRSAGLRTTTLSLIQGTAMAATRNASELPPVHLAVSLEQEVVLSTDGSATAAAVLARTDTHRTQELAALAKYGEWAPIKDAMQTVLAWSFMYDPKEGMVAPEYFWVPQKGGFAHASIDGDTSEGLFCWDGSFASYMLSLDALDWSISNLIQIVKMRTSAGFIPSLSMGTGKSRDRSNPPVTAKVLHEITLRWGANRTRWVVELCFEDLYTWNTWMWTQRREMPLGLLSWGSDPYPYAPDGTKGALTGGGRGAATLESGLDNGVMYDVPFNQTGRYVQDEYDAGYTGMFLMDCQAQLALARLIGRDTAIPVLQARFDTVNQAMKKYLWSEEQGYYMNKLSDVALTPIDKMAPTNFYPLLVGPTDGPSEAQAVTMVQRHLTNRSRFAVWPSGSPPTDHPVPPMDARPLVQYFSCHDARDFPCPAAGGGMRAHRLCATAECNFNETGMAIGSYIRRFHSKLRFEGMAVTVRGSIREQTEQAQVQEQAEEQLLPIYEYVCPALNASVGPDFVLGPDNWKPRASPAPCPLWSTEPALYVRSSRGTGVGASDMVELATWWKPGDHYTVSSAAGVLDASANGYKRLNTLGFVFAPPGTVNASSRWGLPSISKDSPAYSDQDYWHGRIWAPMVQLTMWGMEQYKSTVVRDAAAGLVAQSKNLLMRNWRGFDGSNSAEEGFAGNGRYVCENYGADTGECYSYSSSAVPMYR